MSCSLTASSVQTTRERSPGIFPSRTTSAISLRVAGIYSVAPSSHGLGCFSSAYLFDNGNRTILTERIPGFRHWIPFSLPAQPEEKHPGHPSGEQNMIRYTTQNRPRRFSDTRLNAVNAVHLITRSKALDNFSAQLPACGIFPCVPARSGKGLPSSCSRKCATVSTSIWLHSKD